MSLTHYQLYKTRCEIPNQQVMQQEVKKWERSSLVFYPVKEEECFFAMAHFQPNREAVHTQVTSSSPRKGRVSIFLVDRNHVFHCTLVLQSNDTHLETSAVCVVTCYKQVFISFIQSEFSINQLYLASTVHKRVAEQH